MKSIYDIEMNSAEGESNFLQQFKGKAILLINTTVGCGNAGQMEPIQWIQEKYAGEDFSVVAIPTNDYCGPEITKGRWAEGISCGLDSKNYGEEVYGVTFPFSEMIASNPMEVPKESPWNGVGHGKNGLGQDFEPPHDLYKEVCHQTALVRQKRAELGLEDKKDYISQWLNEHDGGTLMCCNFEKYLIDKDGFVVKHYACTTLNYDVERTYKEDLASQGIFATLNKARTPEIFEEEYAVITGHIEALIAGEKSIINSYALTA
jgi:glutathione peroxidase-family protein